MCGGNTACLYTTCLKVEIKYNLKITHFQRHASISTKIYTILQLNLQTYCCDNENYLAKTNFMIRSGISKGLHTSLQHFSHILIQCLNPVSRSDGPRRAAVLNYFKDGVCSSTDEALLKDIRVPKVWTYNTINIVLHEHAFG